MTEQTPQPPPSQPKESDLWRRLVKENHQNNANHAFGRRGKGGK